MNNLQSKDFIDKDLEQDQEEIVDISPEQKQWILSEIARLQAQSYLSIKNLLILTAYQMLQNNNFQVPRRILGSIHDGSSLT